MRSLPRRLAAALLAYVLPPSRGLKLLKVPLFFVLINSAALASLLEILRGNRYETWETARK